MSEINPMASHEKITEVAKSAIAQAIERHRKLGESIAVWQEGKVVILSAEQILTVQESFEQADGD
jgi:20S proteasome alpha/beta subunit